jgi:ABC-type transporter Mla subunit MlaD
LLEWAVVFREVAVGLGVFLIGLGILLICLRFGRLLTRLGGTLDEVDRQIAALGAPVAETLDHVNGIANTADSALARVGGAVGQLENVAASAAKGANFVGTALSPAVTNVGSTLTGLTSRLRELVRRDGRSSGPTEKPERKTQP